MKVSNLAAVLVFCSSIASAQTTIELIKQRAEAGDVTAQTFLGLAYHLGYGVALDQDAAQQWFSRAAGQGDAFAVKQRDYAAGLRWMAPEKIQQKIDQAASLPYEGQIAFDELASNRDQYIGKVIELNFSAVPVAGGSPVGTSFMYVRDPQSDTGAAVDRLYFCGEGALNWKLEVDKKSYDSSITVYALVAKDGLIAVGDHHREADGGHEYKW
ncbi:MAG: hypothetical protein WC701_06255 [Kiritimatiellales bacterium]|jgi:hypothetical protein